MQEDRQRDAAYEPTENNSGGKLRLATWLLLASNIVWAAGNFRWSKNNLETAEALEGVVHRLAHKRADLDREHALFHLEEGLQQSPFSGGMMGGSMDAFNRLPSDDRFVIIFAATQAQFDLQKKGLDLEITPDLIESIAHACAHDPLLLDEARQVFDKKLLATVEFASGREDKPDSPRVPLKWEMLHDSQQRAVDFAIDPENKLSEDERQAARVKAIEDPTKLQPMIDAYRKTEQFRTRDESPKSLGPELKRRLEMRNMKHTLDNSEGRKL